MKLLYVSTLDHIIHVMLPHLDAARARGWQVEVACKVTRDPAITLAHCDALHDIPFARNPLDPRNLVAMARLRALIRREKYDIVHCHNPSGGFYGRLAATLSGTKPLRVYTAHGFHFHPLGGKLSNFVYRTVEGFAGKHLSDAVLTINQWDFDEARKLARHPKLKKSYAPEWSSGDYMADAAFALHQWEGAMGDRFLAMMKRVNPTPGVGVSTDEFDPAKVSEAERRKIRDEFGVPEDGFLVTCIGEMIPRKRHGDVLEAFAQVKQGDCVLAVVGEGTLRNNLEIRSTQLGIGDRVRFPGFRRDVSAILAASDLFVFPSFQEGLPCAVQEALSMEVPVVAYDVRGCNDMIDDACGRLVPFGDTAAMGNAVAELLALPEETRREMGRAGREKMIELYDRPKCVAAWQAIYDKLLARRGQTTGDSGGSE